MDSLYFVPVGNVWWFFFVFLGIGICQLIGDFLKIIFKICFQSMKKMFYVYIVMFFQKIVIEMDGIF